MESIVSRHLSTSSSLVCPSKGLFIANISENFLPRFLIVSFGKFSDHKKFFSRQIVFYKNTELIADLECDRTWKKNDGVGLFLSVLFVGNEKEICLQRSRLLFPVKYVTLFFEVCQDLEHSQFIKINAGIPCAMVSAEYWPILLLEEGFRCYSMHVFKSISKK